MQCLTPFSLTAKDCTNRYKYGTVHTALIPQPTHTECSLMQTQATTAARELFNLFREDPITFLQEADKRILGTTNRHGTANELSTMLLVHALQNSPKSNWKHMLGVDYVRTLALEYGLSYPWQAQKLIDLVIAAGIPHRFEELVQKLLGKERAPTESDIAVMAQAYCNSQARSPHAEAELKTLIKRYCSERVAEGIYAMRSEGRSWMLETPPKKKVTTLD